MCFWRVVVSDVLVLSLVLHVLSVTLYEQRIGEMDDEFIEWLARERQVAHMSPTHVQQLVQQHLQVGFRVTH